MKKPVLLFIFCFMAGIAVQAQVEMKPDTTRNRGKEYANPGVEGMQRGKGLVMRYERKFNQSITSTEDRAGIGNAPKTTISKDNIAEIKAYIPVINHPHLKFVFGVGYIREEFNFKEAAALNYQYYHNLEDKGLKSLTSQILVLRPVNTVNYWMVRVKGELNGDYTSSELDTHDYLKYGAEAFYGWKKSARYSWGIGAQLAYTFGRQSIYPAILYNRTFNDRWGIESIFPANARMRYNASEHSLWYLGYNVEGSSYNIKSGNLTTPQDQFKTIEIRHNDIKGKVRWEHEILDFLWFGAEGGYNYNIASGAFESGSKRRMKLIHSSVGGAPYASVELFLVPPRNLLKR